MWEEYIVKNEMARKLIRKFFIIFALPPRHVLHQISASVDGGPRWSSTDPGARTPSAVPAEFS
jgi:hypothetical protein